MMLLLSGCPRCIPGAGEGSCADQEAATDAEGNPWMALSPQVPEDAIKLHRTADVHARILVPAEIPSGDLLTYYFVAI